MSSSKRDYYEILSVSRNVTEEELKKAYRKCALAYHPDRNPGDKHAEEKFKECTEAYQVLADPEKKRLYDQYGHAGLQGAGFSGFSGGFADIFEDIFEDFFGGGSGRRTNRAQAGHDLAAAVEISFEEAAFGAEKTLTVEREESCGICKGEGNKPGTQKKSCSSCRGQGQVMASSGFFSIARPCPKCHGQGQIIETPCVACKGAGRVAAKRSIPVKVPAGADSGVRLRIAGEGEAGYRGGPRGNLYVEIHLKEHEIFGRKGDNVLCELPVSFTQAALGCELEVPTLFGPSKLRLPAGTQSGKVFKLKGKGFPSLRGHGLGDEEVRVQVETPTNLSAKQVDLLKQLAELSGEKADVPEKSFVAKMKKMLKPE